MAATESKARIARRVIEVLDFFDEAHPQATVMDIVRRFDWPQSSTSELLSNLVGMGLLYKDRQLRSYSLTPRAALLGSAVQPDFVRTGGLSRLIDRLSAQTGLAVAVFGMVGLKLQICSWRAAGRPIRTAPGATTALRSGEQDRLCDSAAGWLLLSTVDQPVRDGMIRRMSAEATPERRFATAEMAARVQRCKTDGHAIGAAGFGSAAETVAVLLPGLTDDHPLAIGFVYTPSKQIDSATLARSLADAVARSDHEQVPVAGSVQPLFNAA